MAESNSSTQVEYRQIPGYFGYMAGDDGSVWSLHVRQFRTLGTVWRKLRPTIGTNGYYKVCLTPNGKELTRYVHAMVMLAFSDPPASNMEVRHLNGSRIDNRRCNLAWGTHKENGNDMILHGRTMRGELNNKAHLTITDVIAILTAIANGTKTSIVAQQYNLLPTSVTNLCARRSWKHVP